MNYNTAIIGGIVALIVIAAGAAIWTRTHSVSSPGAQQAEHPLKTYYDERYSLAFNFPDNYSVTEHDATGESTKHHTIVIADKAALASVPATSEGPPSITIDIFANPSSQGAESWIKSNSNSNFKLSPDGVMSVTNIAGEKAFAYAWDGLYRSTSIVFPYKRNMFMLSVGQNSPQDQIVKDFATVVSSIQLDP